MSSPAETDSRVTLNMSTDIVSTDDLPPPTLHPSPTLTFGNYKFRGFVCRILGEKDVKLALRHLEKHHPESSFSFAWVLEDYRTLTDEARKQGVSKSMPKSPLQTLRDGSSVPEFGDGDTSGSGMRLLTLLHKMQVLNTLVAVAFTVRRPPPAINASLINPVIPQNHVVLEMSHDDRLKYIIKCASQVLPDFIEVMMDIDELAFINEALLLQQTLMATLPPDAAKKLLLDPAALTKGVTPLSGAVPANWSLTQGAAAASAAASALPSAAQLQRQAYMKSNSPRVPVLPRPRTGQMSMPNPLHPSVPMIAEPVNNNPLISTSSTMPAAASPFPVPGFFPASKVRKASAASMTHSVAKPSLQYLLAVPSSHDSESNLEHLRAQYESVANQYGGSAEQLLDRLRRLPVNPRSALGAAMSAVATGAGTQLHASVSVTLSAAASVNASSPRRSTSPGGSPLSLEHVLTSALASYPHVPPLLVELACFEHPPAAVRQTVSAVAILLQWPDASWLGARTMLLDAQLPVQMCSLDLLSVEPASAQAVSRMLNDPDMALASVRRQSEAAGILLEWVNLTLSALNKAHAVALHQRQVSAPVPSSVAAAIQRGDTTLPMDPPVFSSLPSNLSTMDVTRSGSPRRAPQLTLQTLSTIDVAAVAAHMSAPSPTLGKLRRPSPTGRAAASPLPVTPASYSAKLQATKAALHSLGHAVSATNQAQLTATPGHLSQGEQLANLFATPTSQVFTPTAPSSNKSAEDLNSVKFRALHALVSNPKVSREAIVLRAPAALTPRGH